MLLNWDMVFKMGQSTKLLQAFIFDIHDFVGKTSYYFMINLLDYILTLIRSNNLILNQECCPKLGASTVPTCLQRRANSHLSIILMLAI